MGDRANIYLTNQDRAGHDRGMYLYTHWSGYEWPEALREALSFGRGRWGDDTYLARIIATRVFNDLYGSETGGGLSLSIQDNEYPIICVDLSGESVGFAREGNETSRGAWYNVVSFADYTAQSSATYPAS